VHPSRLWDGARRRPLARRIHPRSAWPAGIERPPRAAQVPLTGSKLPTIPEFLHCGNVPLRAGEFQAEGRGAYPDYLHDRSWDIPMSVKAMKAGALDLLTKPFRDQDMLDAVGRALEREAHVTSQERVPYGLFVPGDSCGGLGTRVRPKRFFPQQKVRSGSQFRRS
jgi:hypothetical protein